MSIEDIDYLKQNSIKENYTFLIDSKDRNRKDYPDPNKYVIDFTQPFKNVIGLEVIDASIPRTMYSVDIYNNSLFYYINDDDLVNNGYNNITTNSFPDISMFNKFEMPIGDYSLQTFMPEFNRYMIINNIPLQIKNVSNPPELTNLITFYSDKPFVLNMYNSTIAETLGFDLNIKNEPNKYKYFDKYSKNEKYMKFYHSIYNETDNVYEITSSGTVYFIGEKYIILRCPEIEEHAFRSLSYSKYNLGIAKFRINSLGFNDEKIEITKMPVREFHPIGKLSKMTLKFETADGLPYDFKGVNHNLVFAIYYYQPKIHNTISFNPILNPNYKPNYNDYLQINEEQDDSEEEDDTEEYSRDNILIYKKNETKYKSET